MKKLKVVKNSIMFCMLLISFSGCNSNDSSTNNNSNLSTSTSTTNNVSSSSTNNNSSTNNTTSTSSNNNINNKYVVMWFNDDGNSLEIDIDVEHGSTPIYNGETPTKTPKSSTISYKFVGWSKEVGGKIIDISKEKVVSNLTFYAVYTETTRMYQVKVNYKDINGNEIADSDTYEYEYNENYSIALARYNGLVPSHDYVKGSILSDNNEITIYYSEVDIWDGISVSTSLSGTGTEQDPYLISSGADLAYLQNNMTGVGTSNLNFTNKYFKMTKSIDLNNNSIKIGKYPGWSKQIAFNGIFDGNNCTVRGLNINTSDMGAGLFSVVYSNGIIKNLNVYGTVVGGNLMNGGIVGFLRGYIENCTSYVNVTGTGETGGVAGTCNGDGEMKNCTNYGSVIGSSQVGGIVGKTNRKITNCTNYGSVKGCINTGGIYGDKDAKDPTIINCTNNGNVVVEHTYSYSENGELLDNSCKVCGSKRFELGISDGTISDPVNYDYSFAVVGDTQIMTYQYAHGKNTNFIKIYDYIINNVESKKIKHVFGLGDIIHTTWPVWGSEDIMKKEAKIAYEQISRMDGVVDYSLNRGNHETIAVYEEYFGVNSRYTNYYEHIEDYYINSANSVHYFSAGNLDYMVVTLDYGAGDKALEWADKIIQEHPYHNVIITTHAFMYNDGTTLDVNELCPPLKPDGSNDELYNSATGDIANNGDHMWEKLVSKHSNIVLVMSGHIPDEDIVYSQWQGKNGNIVTNMLINPQDMDLVYENVGGTGAVAMFYLSNGGKDVEVRYWSTSQNCYIKTSNQFKFTLNTIAADYTVAMNKIDELPEANMLTLSDESKINEIHKLINSMSNENKTKINNLYKFNQCIDKLNELKK